MIQEDLLNLQVILSSLDRESELYTSMEDVIRLAKAFKEGELVWVDYYYGDDNDSD